MMFSRPSGGAGPTHRIALVSMSRRHDSWSFARLGMV